MAIGGSGNNGLSSTSADRFYTAMVNRHFFPRPSAERACIAKQHVSAPFDKSCLAQAFSMRYGLTKCKEATYGRKKQINSGGKAAQKDRSTQGDASTGRGEIRKSVSGVRGSLSPLAFTSRNSLKPRMMRQKNGWKRVSKSTFQDEILSVH